MLNSQKWTKENISTVNIDHKYDREVKLAQHLSGLAGLAEKCAQLQVLRQGL